MNSSFNKNFSRNLRRLFLLAAMMALLASVFTGCMKKENPEPSTEATEPPLLIEPEDETTAATEATEATEPDKPQANVIVEGKMITITGAPVEVRSAAGPDGLVIGTLEVGTQAEVLRQVEFQDGIRWALVRDGWICLDNVDLENGPVTDPEKPESPDVVPPEDDPVEPSKPPRPSQDKPDPNNTNHNTIDTSTAAGSNGVVTVNTELNVRKTPAGEYVGSLRNGTRVNILEQKDGWGRIDKGWVSMKYIKMDGGNTNTNTNNNTNTNTTTGGTKGVVTVNGLNVRSGAGTDHDAVASYDYGTRVNILEKTTVGNGTWGRTKDGWISMGYVYVDGTTGQNTATGTVTGSGLNVRSGPGTNYDVVGGYATGETVKILEQIKVGNTTWGCTSQGWVSMDYIKVG